MWRREESDLTHQNFRFDEGDFLSSEKLCSLTSWVELYGIRLKLVSSVSESLVHLPSSCDR